MSKRLLKLSQIVQRHGVWEVSENMQVVYITDDSLQPDIIYQSIGYSFVTEFDLDTTGNTYIVIAQCLVKGGLLYLIDSQDTNRPNWYPAYKFSLKDNKIPSSWLFWYSEEYIETGGVNAIWGYPELILIDEHFDGLIERDKKALEIFAFRKTEIMLESTKRASAPS